MKINKLLTVITLIGAMAAVTGCGEEAPNPNNQRKFRDQPEIITLTNVIKDGEKQGYPAPSTGNTRVLVVPIEFTDYPADEIGMLYNSETSNGKALKHFKEGTTEPAGAGRGAENAREDIRKVYFGDANETSWNSLRSYYESSSYGNLHFNGIVTPWFKAVTNVQTWTPLSAKEFHDNGGTAAQLAQNILTYYTDDVAKKYRELKKEDGSDFVDGTDFLKYFDSNNDGCFDLLEMVYSAPFYATYKDGSGNDVSIDNDMFWAYCGGTGTEGDTRKPKLSKWAWQSYYTTVEGGTFTNNKWRPWTCEEISDGVAKVDAHTIVHETGHGLGLADYYDYDYKRSPLCGVDMMDHNVGDHNAYSKSILGWTNPTVVTGPTTVTIGSFTKNGDCIMVPYRGYFKDNQKYGNTFFTEYLSIELYNGVGVNKADSEHNYSGSYPLCPSKTGLKIFHVDSRLALVDYSSGAGKFIDYTDSIVSTSTGKYVQCGNSNTGSETVTRTVNGKKEYNWLIEYLGRNPKESVSTISNENLFQQGDSFGYDTYSNYKFNSGKSFGYKFKIESMTDDSCTITFYQA